MVYCLGWGRGMGPGPRERKTKMTGKPDMTKCAIGAVRCNQPAVSSLMVRGTHKGEAVEIPVPVCAAHGRELVTGNAVIKPFAD